MGIVSFRHSRGAREEMRGKNVQQMWRWMMHRHWCVTVRRWLGVFGVLVVVLTVSAQAQQAEERSPYAGQEEREIKALSEADVRGLLAGSGMPFGGMAKAAELNGYPGPRHVLDLDEAGKLALTPEQYRKTRELYEKMRAEAIPLGKQLLEVEKEIDRAFARRTITESFLRRKVAESAELYGKLRFVHLKYHLAMTRLLTPQQIQQYNELRGYHHHRHRPMMEHSHPEK